MTVQQAKSTSFRLDKTLQKPISEWLEHNPGFNMSRLVNIAVLKFITEEQVLKPIKTVKASDTKVDKVARRMMKEHADMLEKLK
jgi:hypothetical protein